MEKREQLGSRLGFIMLSAGCAIGCGNVWKFPWMCGQNGGGSFMLVYVICLLILGLSYMTSSVDWHGKGPNDDEYKIAIEELNAAYAALEQEEN